LLARCVLEWAIDATDTTVFSVKGEEEQRWAPRKLEQRALELE